MNTYSKKKILALVWAVLVGFALLGCGSHDTASQSNPYQSMKPVEPGTVLTSEDMDRLSHERKNLVDRPSPLGEEHDEVSKVRDQVLRKR